MINETTAVFSTFLVLCLALFCFTLKCVHMTNMVVVFLHQLFTHSCNPKQQVYVFPARLNTVFKKQKNVLVMSFQGKGCFFLNLAENGLYENSIVHKMWICIMLKSRRKYNLLYKNDLRMGLVVSSLNTFPLLEGCWFGPVERELYCIS